MASLNKVMVMGNLGKDPEIHQTQSNGSVCNFSVAATEKYTDREGNQQEETEWFRVVCFGKQADNCFKYLSKGRPVFVEGKLKTRKYEAKDGTDRYVTELVAQRVQFLGEGKAAERDDSQPGGQYNAPQGGFGDDDIPF